jgi:GNAT superfamily N-acetyltransferase
MAASFDIRRVDPVLTRPVRRQVLRPHQTLEELIVPGEDDPEAGWFAAYDTQVAGDVVIGTAGVFPEDRPETGPGGWRLRAMAATTPGAGVGTALLEACLAHAGERGGRYLWCSARVPAMGFYIRHGFVTVSDAYEPPGLGPHVTMLRDPISEPGGRLR